MTLTYEVRGTDDTGSTVLTEVTATRFEIQESGTLVFFRNETQSENVFLGDMAEDERPFLAYSEWDEVALLEE